MMASIRIGMVGSIEPVGVNCSRRDRCPHWKIHTTTPNVADSDSTFITIAFSGSTTEPKARNSSTNVLTPVSSAIQGSVAPRLASSSTSPAVVPPTSTVAPAGRGHRGRLVTDVDAGGLPFHAGDLGTGDTRDGIDPVQVGAELGGRSCPGDERLDRSGGVDRELAVQ